MDADIVDRLREISGPIVPNVCTQAADEIERLRFDRTKASVQFISAQMALLDRLDAMRGERDEARRELCDRLTECHFLNGPERDIEVRATAEARGWDCFKRDAK